MIETISESHFLKMLYPEGFSFDCQISDVNFSYAGPKVNIVFHSSQMPEISPKKWGSNVNRVRVELEFSDISKLLFRDWGRSNIIELQYKTYNDEHQISIIGNDCNISFDRKWIRLIRVSSYIEVMYQTDYALQHPKQNLLE